MQFAEGEKQGTREHSITPPTREFRPLKARIHTNRGFLKKKKKIICNRIRRRTSHKQENKKKKRRVQRFQARRPGGSWPDQPRVRYWRPRAPWPNARYKTRHSKMHFHDPLRFASDCGCSVGGSRGAVFVASAFPRRSQKQNFRSMTSGNKKQEV